MQARTSKQNEYALLTAANISFPANERHSTACRWEWEVLQPRLNPAA